MQLTHACEQADRCLAMEIELTQHVGVVDGHKSLPEDGGCLRSDPSWKASTKKYNEFDDSASDATDLAAVKPSASNRD